MLTYDHFQPLALLLLAGACNLAPSGTTTDTDADSTGDAASTTDEPPATGSTSPTEATTGDTTTTEGPEATTTANDPTEADTTGGLDPEQLGACEAYCEHATECAVESDAAECVAACSEDFAELVDELMGECVAENQALLTCAAEISCEELAGEIESGPCSAEWTAFANCYGIEPESGVVHRE
jgi:hypothetical protein